MAPRYLFATTGLMLQGIKDIAIRTPGARFFTLGYCFLVLVLMNTYIAVLSSQLTSSALSFQINTVNDIVGMKVGIYEGDQQALARYRLQNPVQQQWDNQEDEKRIIESLRNGTVDALLMDSAYCDYYSTITCDIYEVGAMVRPFEYSIVMAIDTPQSRVNNAINNALIILKQQGLYDSLYSKYFVSGLQAKSTCPSDKSYQSLTLTQLKLTDMAGLWVFFGAALILGLILNLILWVAKKIIQARRKGVGLSLGGGSISMKGSAKFKFFPDDEDEMTVADAGSFEEMLQVMEKKFKAVDQRIFEYSTNINSALEDLNEKFKANKPKLPTVPQSTLNPQPPSSPPFRSPSQRNNSPHLSGSSWAEKPVESLSRPLSSNRVVPIVDAQDPDSLHAPDPLSRPRSRLSFVAAAPPLNP